MRHNRAETTLHYPRNVDGENDSTITAISYYEIIECERASLEEYVKCNKKYRRNSVWEKKGAASRCRENQAMKN